MPFTRKYIWRIALMLLLLVWPLVAPAFPENRAAAEEESFFTMEDLPHFEHVELENPEPDPLPLGDKGPYAPKEENYLPDNGGYTDSTICVQVEERKIRNTLVYFTYVQIADPSQFRTAMYKPYPSTSWALSNKIAKGRNTIVAMNGDWFANKDNKGRGTIYRNGELIREKKSGLFDSLIVDMNGDFHIIPARKGVGGKEVPLTRFFHKMHRALRIIPLVDGFYFVQGRFRLRRKQRYGHFHARVIRSHDGAEDGRNVQPANGFHFGQMLMGLGKAVLPGRVQKRIAVFALIHGNHLLSAAGIAGEGKAGQRRAGSNCSF